MPNKTIADLKLNEQVIPKDVAYGKGTFVGIDKKSNQYLIGYKTGDPKCTGAWSNSGGKFPDGGVYSENIKDFSHYIFVPATLELHSNDSGKDGLTVGDRVELYCDVNGALTSDKAARDNKQTRTGTIVGFYENGEPLIYIDKIEGFKEIGILHTTNLNRNIHNKFESELDTSRGAFLNGSNGFTNGWLKQTKKGKVKKMSNNTVNGERPDFLNMMKSDMKDAAYRVASKQMVNGTRAAILKLMEQKGHGSDRVQALSDLLNTEFGEALIGMVLGTSLNYIPMVSDDPRAQKLAEEFRIGGMATAGNAVFDMLAQHFLPVITKTLASLPAEGQTAVRVVDQPKVETKDEETEEEKTETKSKAMSA